MSMKTRLETLGGLIKGLVALLALLPGIAILTGLVDIPPSMVQLTNLLSFSASIVILIVIFLLTEHLRTIRNGVAAWLLVVAIVAGGAAATGYMIFANRHIAVVDTGEETERYIIPLRPSPALLRLVAPYDGDYVEALHTSIQKARIRQLMEEEGAGSMIVMMVLLILAQTLLVGAIVAGAWKLVTPELDGGAAPAPTPG